MMTIEPVTQPPPQKHTPRQETPLLDRAEAFGVGALSDLEILGLILGGSEKHRKTAQGVIEAAGGLVGLAHWTNSGFDRGLGRSCSLRLQALLEASRRLRMDCATAQPLLNRADLVAEAMSSYACGLEVEKFWVLCVNRKNRLIHRVEITSGTATAALAHPREVFRVAIRESASAIICVHNHPSGDPAPSAPDIHVTRQLREAAKTVDVELLDHVIIGRASYDPQGRGYFSFREAGLL